MLLEEKLEKLLSESKEIEIDLTKDLMNLHVERRPTVCIAQLKQSLDKMFCLSPNEQQSELSRNVGEKIEPQYDSAFRELTEL